MNRFLIYLFLISDCLKCFGSNDSSLITNSEQFESKASIIESTFRAKRTELGYAIIPQRSDKINVLELPDLRYLENTVELRSGNYWISFLEKSGKFIGLSDHNIISKQFGEGTPSFAEQNKPKWSEESAISKARPFFETFLNNKSFFFAGPTSKYIHTMPNKEGCWEVTWVRTDSKGNLFDNNDYVAVWISETYGPYGLTISLPSRYVEQSGSPLTALSVQEKAVSAAKQTLAWEPVKGMLEPGRLDPAPFLIQLRIVKPNHMLDNEQINTHPDLNARLAWIFWYAWRLNGNPKQIQSVAVWIDAYTGENLGGDAAMN